MADWKRYALPVILWLYGISVAVTLVSLWGRAVVVDSALMAEAAVAVSDSSLIMDRIESWLADELADLPGIDRPQAESVAASLVDDPDLSTAVDELVREVVVAATAPPGAPARVDVADILAPAVPEIAASLQDRDIEVSERAVAILIAGLDPLVLREEGASPPVGPASGAARSLTIATFFGVVAMIASGGGAMGMAADRRAMLRSLINRLAVSALGFAVMFRLGAWVLDPGAGRAPVRRAAAELASAKLWLPMVVAAVAASAAWGVRGRRRRISHTGGSEPVA